MSGPHKAIANPTGAGLICEYCFQSPPAGGFLGGCPANAVSDALKTENARKWTLNSFKGTGMPPVKEKVIVNEFDKVYKSVQMFQGELGLDIKTFPESRALLEKITFKWIRCPDEMDVPVSYTIMNDDNAIIHLNYNTLETQQCLQIITSRFVHEATHALRFTLALHQETEQSNRSTSSSSSEPATKKQKIHVPKKTPARDVPTSEQRYKLTQKHFHSGYLIEHENIGGVVVELQGVLKFGDQVVDAQYALVQEVKDDLINPDAERMTCRLWDNATKRFGKQGNYTFIGKRITRRAMNKIDYRPFPGDNGCSRRSVKNVVPQLFDYRPTAIFLSMFSNFNDDSTYLAPGTALPTYIRQYQCGQASFGAFAAAAEPPISSSLTYPHVPAPRSGPGHAAPVHHQQATNAHLVPHMVISLDPAGCKTSHTRAPSPTASPGLLWRTHM
eukprot:g60301.t1